MCVPTKLTKFYMLQSCRVDEKRRWNWEIDRVSEWSRASGECRHIIGQWGGGWIKEEAEMAIQTLTSAPEAPGMSSAILRKLIPRVRFIFLEWILRISSRASSFGGGNSIFRSMRPGRKRAGSRMSIRFVAIITYNIQFSFYVNQIEKDCWIFRP